MINIIITEEDKLRQIYLKRPFKVRNADEFDLEHILDIFVDPVDGLSSPFDYENNILKGNMGTGKTMYLRANHAYYLYTVVPTLLAEEELILPVYIKLSDFQHLNKPEEIYSAFIIKFIEEITTVYSHFQDGRKLAELHNGINSLPIDIMVGDRKLAGIFNELTKLTALEYVQKIQSDISYSGKTKNSFFDLAADYKKGEVVELKENRIPSVKDIENAYNALLKDYKGKILLLIDEAGSLNKSFFKSEDGESSYFEILMNQLRTLDYVRTKVAVYPNSYSDVLNETRYGDVIQLQEDILNEKGYQSFENRAKNLIKRYASKSTCEDIEVDFLFNINEEHDLLEQLINASQGNIRRLIQLLDQSLNTAFDVQKGTEKVNIRDVLNTVKDHANKMESQFSPIDQDFLSALADSCKTRGTFRFQFPSKSPLLSKYVNKSSEYNVINIIENGTGRRGTTYAFDYAYCVLKDIPTHYIKQTERINKLRTRNLGDWIRKVTRLSDNLIEQTMLPGKIEGVITFLKGSRGFIKCDEDGIDYYFEIADIILEDRGKLLTHKKRVRFIPSQIGEDNNVAYEIEIL